MCAGRYYSTHEKEGEPARSTYHHMIVGDHHVPLPPHRRRAIQSTSIAGF